MKNASWRAAYAGALLLMAGSLSAAEIHVAAGGDDAASGQSTQAALKTIQAAVNRANPGDVVLVHPGTYREAVVFGRSGTADKPITVRAAGEGPATISGCDPVSGWEQYKPGIWKAAMPWTLGAGRNQAFDADGVLIEARFPNAPADGLGMYVGGLSPLWPTFGEFSIPKETMEKQPGRIVSKLLEGQPDDYWRGACYYGLHYEAWSAQTGIIESSKSGEIQVGDRTRTWWFGPLFGGNYSPEEGRGMIVGHMNALDQPTEWHWQDNALYLIPRKPGMPTDIQVKRRQVALDLSGREHIRIEGLNIVAASMRLDGSSFCSVDRCNLSYISHFTRFYDIGQVENGKDTLSSGETGVFVGGHDNAFTNCSVRYSAGAGFYLRGYHHTVHNCLIDEIDYTSHYLNAITDAVSDYGAFENTLIGGHVITFNTMRNAGRHFFNFSGNGTSMSSRDRKPMDYMATLFAHNHLYNGMLQTRDAGFITGYFSSGGTLDGLSSQVAYNVMHDCYDIAGMRWGNIGMFYLDQGTCDVDVNHNLLWAAPGAHQRGFWFNTCCVNVRESANIFHPMFGRDSGSLRPADFPEGKPFRFGHDFGNPPELPQWPPLETREMQAEACVAQSAGVSKTATGLAGLRDGDWFSMGEVDVAHGWQTALMRFASDLPELNSDASSRQPPRHRKMTDPLVMEFDHCDAMQQRIRKVWTLAYNVQDGAWIRFNQAPLGAGYRRLRMVYGSAESMPRYAEVRLDRPDGPVVGKVELKQTDKPRKDRVQIYADAVAEFSPEATGTHDLVLVFRTDDGKPVCEFEYLRLEGYRGEIPLTKNEVKLELRVGSRDGQKIGEFYPRHTGGMDQYVNLVAKLDAAPAPTEGAGKKPLFVVVRSTLDKPIGQIDTISLQRASSSGEQIAGVGLPPRSDAAGKPIYPQPTNVPIARPADKYAQTSGGTPRPTVLATALGKAPVVDGKLDEWNASRGRTFKESYDGEPTTGKPSVAWVGYDSEAIYVAMQNPVTNVADLPVSPHQWGACDGAELALQDGLSAKPGAILSLHGYPDGLSEVTDDGGAPAEMIARLQKAVTYKASIDAQGWNCEWRIPLTACGFSPKSAPRVLLNLGVFKKAQKAWVVLHGTGGPTYNVERGATLVFPAEFAAVFQMPREKLLVWLDAADTATISRDKAGVTLWKDKSGTGHHAHQAAAANRPGFAADGLNGKPALVFDEKRQTRLELPDLASGQVDATILAVVANSVASAPENNYARIFTASDGKGYDYQIGLCCLIPDRQTGGPRLVTTLAHDAWAKQARVGCFSPMYQTFFTGQISEIVVYLRQLDAQEAASLRDYLAAKWELSE